MVQVAEMLRLSLNSGSTVDDAIKNTLSLDINNCFKKRLSSWLAKVEAGNNISASATKEKLPNTIAWAFDQQVNQGNTLAVLESIETFYRLNYSYRVNLALFTIEPCTILLLGAVVGTVIYSIFSPLVEILNYLANTVP